MTRSPSKLLLTLDGSCIATWALVLFLLTSCKRNDLSSGPQIHHESQPPPPPECQPPPPPTALQVKINEVMIENTKTLADEGGHFVPWVEIYNPNDSALNLGCIPFSDDLITSDKWTIPNVPGANVEPHGFMVIFLDGEAGKQGLHANFTLEPGAQLSLIINQGSDIFFFDGTEIGPDQSAGRFPDGGSQLAALSEPTPSAPNKEPAVPPQPTEGSFVRGDANGDGRVNVSDMNLIVKVLFQSGASPRCQDRLDANDDGVLNLTDVLFVGRYLFQKGAIFPPPFPQPGPDPTPDSLPCPAN